jgi:hypothetical protein
MFLSVEGHMKSIALALAASIVTFGAGISVSAASAQGTSVARAVPLPPRLAVPPSINTGGFMFGFPPAPRSRGYVRGIYGGDFGGGHPGNPGKPGHGDGGDGRFDELVEPFYGYGNYGYSDGDGYVNTIPMSNEPGFFANGGTVDFDGEKPVYDYDRSYPYDFYKGQPTERYQAADRSAASSSGRCDLRDVPDGNSGRIARVRVCRRG